MTNQPTLYERLGGEAGITRLIDRFYERVLADPELAPFFKDAPMDKLRHMQREFFTAALDGPPIYSGLSLSWVHSGRGIQTRHFARFVEHLLTVLREQGASEEDARTVIGRINTYLGDITGEATRDT